VPSQDHHPAVEFEPLRPASRGRLILGLILGPVLWLVALIVAGTILRYTRAIEIGLLVTLVSFLLSLVVLLAIRSRRLRLEGRYASGG
jgi:hypothetical protein